MNPSGLIGILATVLFLAIIVLFGADSPMRFVDPVGLAVVVGGTLAATFMSYPPGEVLRSRFPTQVKIGPVERIRDLVNLQLPGVVLRPLPVAPRQIPYHAGFNYFELDTRNNELWKQLETSGGMAMHIAGDFPGLELEFWAIRA